MYDVFQTMIYFYALNVRSCQTSASQYPFHYRFNLGERTEMHERLYGSESTCGFWRILAWCWSNLTSHKIKTTNKQVETWEENVQIWWTWRWLSIFSKKRISDSPHCEECPKLSFFKSKLDDSRLVIRISFFTCMLPLLFCTPPLGVYRYSVF